MLKLYASYYNDTIMDMDTIIILPHNFKDVVVILMYILPLVLEHSLRDLQHNYANNTLLPSKLGTHFSNLGGMKG